MMMMSQSQNDEIVLDIKTFNDQQKSLTFDSLSDLKLFLDTDFEITNINVPDGVSPVEVADLLKRQDIMDVNRSAYINIQKNINDRTQDVGNDVKTFRPEPNPEFKSDPFDLNIRSNEIRVI